MLRERSKELCEGPRVFGTLKEQLHQVELMLSLEEGDSKLEVSSGSRGEK